MYPNMAKLQSSHKFYKSDTKPTCVPLMHWPQRHKLQNYKTRKPTYTSTMCIYIHVAKVVQIPPEATRFHFFIALGVCLSSFLPFFLSQVLSCILTPIIMTSILQCVSCLITTVIYQLIILCQSCWRMCTVLLWKIQVPKLCGTFYDVPMML